MPTLLTSDGTPIYYEVTGSGIPPLVFVHGWCSNLRHWDAQVGYFALGHRVLAVDRRGQGRSGVSSHGYTVEQHAADLAEVLAREEIDGAIVVGHAGGAPTVLELARSYPDRVRALVAVDAVPPRRRVGGAARNGTALTELVDRLAGPDGGAVFEAMYRGFFDDPDGPVGRAAVADALGVPLSVAVAELRGLDIDTLALAQQIRQPVLWLTVGPADRATVGAAFRGVQYAEVTGSGHFPHLEAPDQVDSAIERFVVGLAG